MIHLLFALALATATQNPTPDQCFTGTEQHYNDDIANNAPIRAFQQDYEAFADCADMAIKVKAWDYYFADTIGALYSQIQMAGLSSDLGQKCSHYAIAYDLAQQAQETNDSQTPPDANFDDTITNLMAQLTDQLKSCK